MAKSAYAKVTLVGRVTVFFVGLAVVLALLFGVATTALGTTTVNFVLGKSNVAVALSKLVGNVAGGPALVVSNASTEAGSRALQLDVAEDKAPLRTNPAAGTATNLSADELDGRDSSDFATSHVFATVNANGSLDAQASSSHAASSSRLEKGIYMINFDHDVGRFNGCVHVAQPLDEAAYTMTAEGPRYGGPLNQVQIQQRDAAGDRVDGAVSLVVFCR